MHPAIPQGSFVCVNRLAYALRQPKIGEVVVMRHPRKSNADIIKRVRDVQDNSLFVVGDNAAHSTDSRFFGAVKHTDIIGRVIGVARP